MQNHQIIDLKIANLRRAAKEANELEDWARLVEIGAEINALNLSRLGDAGARAHVANLNAANDRAARRWEQVAAEAHRAAFPPACDQVARIRIRAVRPRTSRRGTPPRRRATAGSSASSSDPGGDPPADEPRPAPGKAAGQLADQLIAAVLDELRDGNAAELTATIDTAIGNAALSTALIFATLALGDEGIRFEWAPVEPAAGEAHRLFVFAEPKR
jgi:hypothetical protein